MLLTRKNVDEVRKSGRLQELGFEDIPDEDIDDLEGIED